MSREERLDRLELVVVAAVGNFCKAICGRMSSLRLAQNPHAQCEMAKRPASGRQRGIMDYGALSSTGRAGVEQRLDVGQQQHVVRKRGSPGLHVLQPAPERPHLPRGVRREPLHARGRGGNRLCLGWWRCFSNILELFQPRESVE